MPAPHVIIRQARQRDLEPLCRLIRTLFAIEEDFHFEAGKARQGLELLLGHPGACVLVAEMDGLAAGMATGQLTISTAEGGPALLVEDVVVHGDWRGQGLGRRLMDALADWAMERGATRLQLLADCNNHQALSFYRHLGWKTTSLLCLRRYARK